jgi:integrase/recombinase XerC
MNADAAIDAWLALPSQRTPSPHTALARKRDLDKFRRALSHDGIDELAQVDGLYLRGLLGRWHAGGLAPKSIARLLSTLRGLFRHARVEGWIDADPSADLRPPKARRRLPEVLDPDEMKALVELPVDSAIDARDRALLELFYSAGLRLSELASLRWPNLDLTDGTVRVLGKGNKERIVPVGAHASAALIEWRAVASTWPGADSQHIFLNGRGGALSHRAIQQRLKTLAQRQGIWKRVHPHLLRHSFASHVLESSGNLRAVQELLGHANLTTTQIYTHLDYQHLARVYDQAHPRARALTKADDADR